MIMVDLKTKQTPHKNKGKLESFKKLDFHKLNLYLNQTTIQTFIINLIYKDIGLSTSGRLVHWVRLRGLRLSYTIHLFRSANISNLGYSLSRSVLISNLRYSFHIHKVNPYVLFQSAHISNLGHDHMNLFDSSLTGKFHLYESMY